MRRIFFNIKSHKGEEGFEIKSENMAKKTFEIEGFASTIVRDRVDDVVLPKAFESSLPVYLKNPIMLFNHDQDNPIGKFTELKITDEGLYVKGFISKTRPDIQEMVKEGVLSTLSIGYNTIDAEFDHSKKANIISNLELLEISVVSIPANHTASMGPSSSKSVKFNTGDFVEWVSYDGIKKGRIVELLDEGYVPGIDISIKGTKENPAARIRMYDKTEEGWIETNKYVGYHAKDLKKIRDIKYQEAAVAVLGLSNLLNSKVLSYNINELVDIVATGFDIEKNELNQELKKLQGAEMKTKEIVSKLLKSIAEEEKASENQTEEVKSEEQVEETKATEIDELTQLVSLLKNFIERADLVLKYIEASEIKEVEAEDLKAKDKKEKEDPNMDDDSMKTDKEKEEEEAKEEAKKEKRKESENAEETKSEEQVEETKSEENQEASSEEPKEEKSEQEKLLELECEILEEEVRILENE